MRKLINKKNKLFYNMKLLKYIFYVFFSISLFFIFVTSYIHPMVGDDYYFKEIVILNSNFFDFFKERYFNWTGRVSSIVLTFLVFSDNLYLLLLKLFLVPLMLISCNNILKKILDLKINFFSINFIVIFICFWFIYPAINETIIWTSGSITYFFPLFFSIIYLGLFTEKKTSFNKNIFFYFFSLLSSFLAGSSHLQVFVGCFIVSSFFIFHFYKSQKQRFNQLKIFYLLFITGGAVLILAPGNYVRLTDLVDFDLVSILYKSFLFMTTSIFYLGDVQSSLIYFLIIIFLIFFFSKKISLSSFYNKFNYIWLIAFFASLLIVIPAINSVSTRLIFFPIFFLSIYLLKVIFFKHDLNKKFKFKNIAVGFLTILILLETFLGCITNYSYKKENVKRFEKIIIAKNNSEKYVEVSHYTIIPSRLTYVQTPEHDSNFLENISKIYKIKINYLKSFPRSTNIRKKIKYFFK